MSDKKSKYANIRKWADKQDERNPALKELNGAVNDYETATRELHELKAALKDKTERRKTAYDALEATYKLAKLKSKQTPVPDEKAKKGFSIKKPEKRAAKEK